jgi:hypothetical protein
MTRSTLRALFLALPATGSVLAAVAACTGSSGPGGDGESCPTFDTSCAATPPSWQNDVQPLIGAYCLRCHVDGGVAPPQFDYSTYQGVFQSRAVILTQVDQCKMPPSDAAPPAAMPSQQERQTLISWLACNAPNN